MSKTTIQSIPVLDFSLFETDPKTFLDALKPAARDVGFFYLTGHGIAQSLIDDVLSASRRFFSLPEADKLKIEMVNSPHFRGYNRIGQELTKGQRDWREQIDIGSEAAAVPFGKAKYRAAANFIGQHIGKESMRDMFGIAARIFSGAVGLDDAGDLFGYERAVDREVVSGCPGVEPIAEVFIILREERMDHGQSDAID